MTQSELADYQDGGVEDSNHHKTPKDSEYKNKTWLKKKYYDEGWSVQEMADDQDVTRKSIQYWMEKYSLEARSPGQPYKPTARFETRRDGYEHWANCESTRKEGNVRVLVHRLLAVAEYGVDAVSQHHVHHQNEIPWDNRIDNLELLTAADHARHHSTLDGHRHKGGKASGN